VRTTIWPAYAGTSEPLQERLPKAMNKLRGSYTILTTCWAFSTQSSMETFLTDRKAMAQHSTTIPRVRTTLLWTFHVKHEEWQVWELLEQVPPSTAQEQGLPLSGDPREHGEATKSPPEAASREQCQLPGLVMEVSADGQEVVSWPGPETTPG